MLYLRIKINPGMYKNLRIKINPGMNKNLRMKIADPGMYKIRSILPISPLLR